jgi:hypothetical protein
VLEFNKEKNITMEEAIKILKHSEVVLMKKIKAMKDGKPKWAASAKLNEIRSAIQLLVKYDMVADMDEQDETAILQDMFTAHPPKAMA